MSKIVRLFQTISQEMLNNSHPYVDIKYWYIDSTHRKVELIPYEGSDKALTLEDENDGWDYKSYGLGLSGQITFQNSDELFGIDGLVNEDAVLGVALRCYSKKTAIQKIEPIGELHYNNNSNLSFDYYIDNIIFYGDLLLEIILYVKEASRKKSFGKANIVGTIIDYLWLMKVNLDGLGGAFPITTVEEAARPLWYVEFNYSDPFYDAFDTEYVNICINAKHKQYTELMDKKSKWGNLLLQEVMTGALFVIIQKLLNDSATQSIYDEKNPAEEGSIIAAIRYFKKAINWTSDEPEKLAEAIRLYFQRESKAGDFDD